MKFSIHQLKYASEICFPDTFERLWFKHSQNEGEALYLALQVKRQGLIDWIFSYGRKNFEEHQFGDTINKVLVDLIGDYE